MAVESPAERAADSLMQFMAEHPMDLMLRFSDKSGQGNELVLVSNVHKRGWYGPTVADLDRQVREWYKNHA